MRWRNRSSVAINVTFQLLVILVTDPRVARDYFLWWSHYYYYYFVIWTNLMKSNAFHNHIYYKINFYYCRIVLFKIWNLNSTIWNLNSIIIGWLIFYISKSIKHVLHATCKPSFSIRVEIMCVIFFFYGS